MVVAHGTGAIVSGELHLLAGPRRVWRNDMRPAPLAIYCHGATGGPHTNVQDLAEMPLIRRLSRKFLVASSMWGGDQHGNDLSIDLVEDGIANLRSTLNIDDDPVMMIGLSMGAGLALSYTRRNPSMVRAMAGMIPGLDLTYAHTNDVPAGVTAVINSVYGGAYSEAVYGAEHNPVTFASTLPADLPVRLWTSSNDTWVPPSTATAFVAARPQTVRTNLGAVGHGTASINGFQQQIADWCIEQEAISYV